MVANIIRQSSPDRWEAALARGRRESLVVSTHDGIRWTCQSKRGGEYIILVDASAAIICNCAAGAGGDPVCKHRALVNAALNQSPVSTALPRLARRCATCGGDGHVSDEADREFTCFDCAGTGLPRY